MARFKIEGPGGQVFTIEGPEDATDDEILSFAEQEFAKIPHQPKQPGPAVGEVATDVAKSAGIGLVEGGIGLATLPGNLEALGRLGINSAAGLAGLEPPVSNDAYLPTFDDGKKLVEGYTGEFYKPKTTAGKYANTIGQFAPMAIGGPASLVAKVGRVLAPAVTSETAGQLTEGTSLEPWARAGGALVGGFAGPTFARRAVTPNPIDPRRAQQLQTLEKEGVTAMTAGQRTGNRKIRWAEEVTSDTPFSGGKATKINTTQQEQFTKAALKRAGIQADRATPEALDDAFTAIGKEYESVAIGLTIKPSAQFVRNVSNIAHNYERITPEGLRIPMIREVVEDLVNNFNPAKSPTTFDPRPVMSGKEFAGIRSALTRAQRGIKSNPQAYNAVGDIVRALDAKMLASVPKGQRATWGKNFQDMNRRYKNLLAIEDAAAGAGENAAMGLISPAALKNAVKKQDKKGYTRNRNDMAPLARAGEAILKPLPQSGTGPRSFWQTMFAAPTAAGGAMIAGAPGAAIGALAPVSGQALGGRLLMSGPMQRYLSNQAMPGISAQELTPLQIALLRGLAVNQGAEGSQQKTVGGF